MKYVAVQFTGNTTLYPYAIDAVEAEMTGPGQRIVVPTKMKNDGTVTLTIATVVEVGDPADKPEYAALGVLKPIIALLDPARIALATELVAKMEAKV